MCFLFAVQLFSFHPDQSVSLSADRGWREGRPVREAEGRRRAHQHKRIGALRQPAGSAHPHQGIVPDTEAHSQEVNTQSSLTRTVRYLHILSRLQSEYLSVFQERTCVCRPVVSSYRHLALIHRRWEGRWRRRRSGICRAWHANTHQGSVSQIGNVSQEVTFDLQGVRRKADRLWWAGGGLGVWGCVCVCVLSNPNLKGNKSAQRLIIDFSVLCRVLRRL